MAVDPVNTSQNGSSTVNFRPDPGEPAVRLSAPANQTALLVTAQELRNETRLRSRAIAQGDEILFTNRTFTQGGAGGDAAVVGGLTSLVFREGGNQPQVGPDGQDQISISEQARDALQGAQNEGADSTGELGAEEETDGQLASPLEEAREEGRPGQPRDDSEIQEDQEETDQRQDRVETDIQEAEEREEDALTNGSVLEAQQARAEQAQLQLEEREVERDKNQLELERLENRLQEANQNLTSTLEDNVRAAAGPLAALFGAGDPSQDPQRGGILDLIA